MLDWRYMEARRKRTLNACRSKEGKRSNDVEVMPPNVHKGWSITPNKQKCYAVTFGITK
ncbi:unnamed protein product [Sphenostylis stenocarpa]|uniref:Uncharacterized protein n=1 Tax=Sphenostylis stenocarpa TaxID=92480 RepID=A0AA86RQR5_9FABA|nr:unnamed protein product [Sphenostylis stenocarpa]